MGLLKSVVRTLYPPHCVSCGGATDSDGGLCGPCWRDTPFILGLACDQCGTPLPGADGGHGRLLCDDCLMIARPWTAGSAALAYTGQARRMVLQLKHSDRMDIARPAGLWMARRARSFAQPGLIVAPVPLHWMRLARRRYNQAALLSAEVARALEAQHIPDLVTRLRRTRPHEGMTLDARFANQQGAYAVAPRHLPRIKGAPVLLIDDVMTSGATLGAVAEACHAAGASRTYISVMARVAKDA